MIISSKHKYYLLIIGLILLFIFILKNNVLKNFALYHEVKDKQNEIKHIQVLPAYIDSIHLLLKKISGESNTIGISNENLSNQDLLLRFLADFSKNHSIKVINFPTVKKQTEGNSMIEINHIELEGDFNTLLSVLYNIENNQELSGVIHSKFFISKNFKTDKKYLHLVVYTKKFSNIK